MNLLLIISEFLEALTIEIITAFRQFIVSPSISYIRLLTGFVWIPEIIDFVFYKKIILQHWKTFAGITIIFIPHTFAWDFHAVKNGIWHFPGTTIGIYFYGTPLEDYLFGIFVSWLIIFIFLFFYNVEKKRNAGQL